ncbi:hypothetical protein NE237_000495 [Protea cynaroides]|uniref:Wax synthase domain-containing protein n=1 Tax=Protea cynaroides TaxID=273540 RepID=A0A9Q0QXJ4_9MAGN|nr:hypothetical protein NE237_000495 [Protea cynaroides]
MKPGSRGLKMEEEMKNFILIWVSVFVSLTYSYIIGRRIPKGSLRFLFLVPVLCLFLFLPLNLSSPFLVGITAFFITFLCIFKLLLFAFDQGPLSLTNPTMSFLCFIFLASLPITIKQDRINKQSKSPNLKPKSPLNYAIKAALFALVIRVYDYRHDYIHPKLVHIVHCVNVYLILELLFAMVAYLAKALVGLELEDQFNEPYLSTSLQDFWSRRWNISGASILRSTVYEPTQRIIAATVLGRRWVGLSSLTAVLATFLVSGLMHELIYFYLGRTQPTWEITWYHVLHGFCLAAEVAVKKVLAGRWQLHRVLSGPLTIGFVLVTTYWLFFPQLLRFGSFDRTIEERAALIEFVKQVIIRNFGQGFRESADTSSGIDSD